MPVRCAELYTATMLACGKEAPYKLNQGSAFQWSLHKAWEQMVYFLEGGNKGDLYNISLSTSN